ncbi:TonB family protein [bacterium]|nr:TonB family protein [bacterium]
MKTGLLCSLLMHLALAAAAVFMPDWTAYRMPAQEIREVTLISMPRPEEKPAVREPQPSPAPDPEPVPEQPAARKEEKTLPQEPQPEQPSHEQRAEQPPDSSLAQESPGGGGDVKVDSEDFPYSYYLSLIRYRIKENWRPPLQIPGEDGMLTTVIVFRILRSGQVSDVGLEAPSGRFLFDQAARRAIGTMRSLPPLPPEFSGEYLTVHIEFESEY